MNTIVVTLPCLADDFHGDVVTTDDIDWGTEEDITFPSKKEVCPDCGGHGKVLNASIRYHAYTSEDMDEDPDFFEEYQRGPHGIYGVTCPTCNGRNVVDTIDEGKADPVQLQVYKILQREIRRDRLEEERTYRMEMDCWE